MSGPTDVQRALTSGAYRSIRACSLPACDPLPVRIWRRHRWSLTAVALFVVMELIGLGGLITGGFPNH